MISCIVLFAAGVASAGPPHLPEGWGESAWISVRDAPVAAEPRWQHKLATPGTSCFVKHVRNSRSVRRAVWTTAGLGVYELYLNGERIGEDFLKPGFTHNVKTKYAFSHDVTAAMRRAAGETNAFGAEVSSGWWRDGIVFGYGRKSAFRCLLTLTYDDGSEERHVTRPEDWFGEVAGPVRSAGIFDGERFDARETNGARTPAAVFTPGGCETNDEFRGETLPSAGAEVCLRTDLAMRRGPFTLKPGVTNVVDFGQNCAAVPRFRFRARRGTVLTALPGEMLNDADAPARGCDGPKGSVYRANLRLADGMRLDYAFAGRGVETYLPHFTFFGYRYLALCATDEVEIESVESVPVSSIRAEDETGRLETGDARVNRLISNAYWGQLSNYLSVPTDCPQRNERVGWSADTQVFAEAGAFNADTSAFLRKWMRDMRDTQIPAGEAYAGSFPQVAPTRHTRERGCQIGWSDAGVIVPYRVFRQFGDRRIVDENWEAMGRFMDEVARDRYVTGPLAEDQCGDWLSFEDYEVASKKAKTLVGGKRVLKDGTRRYWKYLGGCYWLWDARMMAAMAAGTGRREESARYGRMADEARDYLRAAFVGTDGLLPEDLRKMQTPALFALKLGLIPDAAAVERTKALLRENFAAHGGCLQTGFLGTSVLMDALTESGMTDLAYDVLLNRRHPGWLYSVDQGATTIWERWNSYTSEAGFGPVGMNSFNHYAAGAVVAWIYKTAAGIASDEARPGFRRIVMAPQPDRRLGFVKAEYRSAAGLIRSAWRYEDEKWIWEFAVPEGATASVLAPGWTAAKEYGAGSHKIVTHANAKPQTVAASL